MSTLPNKPRRRVTRLKKQEPVKAPVIRNRLLNLVVGKQKARKTKADNTIVHGQQYGKLTLNKKQLRWKGESRTYGCHCPCGRTIYLPAPAILARAASGYGCLQPGCHVDGTRIRAWADQDFALRLQLAQMLALWPDDVANEWGGRAFDSLPSVKRSEGYATFVAQLEPLIDRDACRWWVHRVNRALPFADFNIELKTTPSRELFKNGFVVRYSDSIITIEDLAEALGLTVEDVLAAVEATESEDDFVSRLVLGKNNNDSSSGNS